MIKQQPVEICFAAPNEMNLKELKYDLGNSKHSVVNLGNAKYLKERLFSSEEPGFYCWFIYIKYI